MSEHEGHSGMQKENSGSSNSSMIHNNKIKRIAVSNTFQKQLDEVFEAYIEVMVNAKNQETE